MNTTRGITATAITVLVLFVCTDIAVRATFPHFVRLSANFSAMYLQREIFAAALDPRATVFLGDSALWGFRLPATAAAPSLLRDDGCDCRNLSFEGGSPANTYAMLSLLVAAGAAPKTVVFNVNQKEFNPADRSYGSLYPSVQTLAEPLLTSSEKSRLAIHGPVDWNRSVDASLSRIWALYAMRSDIREAVFGDVDAVHALQTVIERQTGALTREADAHRPTADRFEGTYDLTPLATENDNVAVAFSRQIGALIRAHHVSAVAILTPTNHRLLHDYIDTSAYDQNLAYIRRLLTSYGVRVLNFDRAIPSNEFIDNDHLTAEGNRRLAKLLGPVVGKP